CRIDFIEQSKPYFRIFSHDSFYSFDRLFVSLLDTNNDFFCTDSLTDQMKCIYDLSGVLFKQLPVQSQQRLTFRTVQDNRVRTLIQLCICRESCTTGADDTVLLHYAA